MAMAMASASLSNSNFSFHPSSQFPHFTSSSCSITTHFLLPPKFFPSLKHFHNPSSSFPIIRAQSSPDFVPEAKFYKVEAILRPWRIQQVSKALLKMGIRGVTVSDVRGFGAQGGLTERQAGSEFSEDNFVAKVKMEIVVSKDQVEGVIAKIIEEARTGEIGDGKIFLTPIADVIRVRTGERGEKAERMMGGHADMTSTSSLST
ncbi:Nitrogen regulatory protein P-II -like protein [Capsicum baccatum]|uniref:Nitrogen regulatory protein P-II-like protein n=1 Tax=Capsicum baccatum TaxID=33114 RepID=A0A2G2WH29_CAPBA|nr:Nitrogen regulatory protein P-II -like protein [Capsicum baccatum]